MIERKKRLLHELSCILMELEQISAGQEIEEISIDPVVSLENLSQFAKEVKKLEIPAAEEQLCESEIQETLPFLVPIYSHG